MKADKHKTNGRLKSRRDMETGQTRMATVRKKSTTRNTSAIKQQKKTGHPFLWTFLSISLIMLIVILVYISNRNKEIAQNKKIAILLEENVLLAKENNIKKSQSRVILLSPSKIEKKFQKIFSDNEWDDFFKTDAKSSPQIDHQQGLPAFLAEEQNENMTPEIEKSSSKKTKFELLIVNLAKKLLSNESLNAYKSLQNNLNDTHLKLTKKERVSLEALSTTLDELIEADKTVALFLEERIGETIILETVDGAIKVKILDFVPSKAYIKVKLKTGNTILDKKIKIDSLTFNYKLKIVKNSGKMSKQSLTLYRASDALKKREYTEAFQELFKIENPVTFEMLKIIEAYHHKEDSQFTQRTFQWLLLRGKIKSGEEDLLKIRTELIKRRLTERHVNKVIALLRDHYAEFALQNYFVKADVLKKGEMTKTKYKKIREMAENYKDKYAETGYYHKTGKALLRAFIRDGLAAYRAKFTIERKINFLDLVLIPIESGKFKMGHPALETKTVNISKPFWIGKYEITQNQYKIIMETKPSIFKQKKRKQKYPVENVSWYDAMEFCRRLTEIAAKNGNVPEEYEFRLPTSSEWEYCCKAGTKGKYSFNMASELFKYGNYCDKSNSNQLPYQDKFHKDGFDKTSQVGVLKANPWGIFDMHGNVWEWCFDWEGKNGDEEFAGPVFGTSKILKGGAWDEEAYKCSSFSTSFESPSAQFDNLGFRVVLAPIIIRK